jgi:hypothetical protein
MCESVRKRLKIHGRLGELPDPLVLETSVLGREGGSPSVATRPS